MKEETANNEKIIIRKADPSDAKALVEYMNLIGGESDYLTFGAGEFEKSAEQEREFIESALNRNNALFLVAEVDGKIVGNLHFSGGQRPKVTHTGDFGISVLKKYWGNGIGEELIRRLIRWSKDSKVIRKLNLCVRTDNTRGMALYKKMGFEEEGKERRAFFVDGKFYDSLLMGLLID